MAGALIEGGIYLLIFFTPFAFGGVELWARGVFQIISGLVVFVWLLDRMSSSVPPPRKSLKPVTIPIVLFILIVLIQLVPLSPGMIKLLSPGTHDVYSRTIPGYADGEPFRVSDLAPWLIEDKVAEIPAARAQVTTDTASQIMDPPRDHGGFAAEMSGPRTLSLHPGMTQQRLALFLSLAGVFMVVVGHFSTPQRLNRLMTATVLSGFGLSFFGILQNLTWNGNLYWIREGSYANVFGPFVNRNSYAAFAGTIVPVAVCMGLAALWRRQEGRGEDSLPRLFLWMFTSITIAGGVFLSLSRGGILATALSMGIVFIFLIYYGRRRAEMVVIGSVMLLLLGFVAWIGPERVVERIGTLSEGQSIPSFEHRSKNWARIPTMVSDYPVFGSGLGTFRFAFLSYAPPGERWFSTAHNEYFEIIAETGIAGTLVFLAGFGGFVVLVARPGRFRGRSARYLYTGMVAGLVGLLVHSAISSNLQVPANGLLLVVFGGALLRMVVDGEPRDKHLPRAWRSDR